MGRNSAVAFALPMRNRFRGITVREGLLVHGPAGWGEWSPFAEYERPEIDNWWRATMEAANLGFPVPVRDRVPVNVTVPAVDPETAYAIVAGSGCGTAKVKVAEPGQSGTEDAARLEAVRDALGPSGRLRIDANGAWDVDTALSRLAELAQFGLEYVEQPCATVDELAELRRLLARRGLQVPIAADESIRRSGDPERVVALEAADIAVLKVQPLGGVRACLELAERLALPVVVSSALESSVGLAAGVALAAALPELPYACGLNTATMFTMDVTDQPLVAIDGAIPVRTVAPAHRDPYAPPAAAHRHPGVGGNLGVEAAAALRDGRSATSSGAVDVSNCLPGEGRDLGFEAAALRDGRSATSSGAVEPGYLGRRLPGVGRDLRSLSVATGPPDVRADDWRAGPEATTRWLARLGPMAEELNEPGEGR